jgi:hypothetical protein
MDTSLVIGNSAPYSGDSVPAPGLHLISEDATRSLDKKCPKVNARAFTLVFNSRREIAGYGAARTMFSLEDYR